MKHRQNVFRINHVGRRRLGEKKRIRPAELRDETQSRREKGPAQGEREVIAEKNERRVRALRE